MKFYIFISTCYFELKYYVVGTIIICFTQAKYNLANRISVNWFPDQF